MRHYLIVLTITLIVGQDLWAQRMVPGQKGLELSIGLISYKQPVRNHLLNISVTSNTRSGAYWLCSAGYSRRSFEYRNIYVPMETYTAEAGYSIRILGNDRKSLNINLAVLVLGGYEMINRGDSQLYDGAVIQHADGFVYGASGRLSLEKYLSDRFILLLQAKSSVLWGTTKGQLRPSAGVGLRFNF